MKWQWNCRNFYWSTNFFLCQSECCWLPILSPQNIVQVLNQQNIKRRPSLTNKIWTTFAPHCSVTIPLCDKSPAELVPSHTICKWLLQCSKLEILLRRHFETGCYLPRWFREQRFLPAHLRRFPNCIHFFIGGCKNVSCLHGYCLNINGTDVCHCDNGTTHDGESCTGITVLLTISLTGK